MRQVVFRHSDILESESCRGDETSRGGVDPLPADRTVHVALAVPADGVRGLGGG
jgi:hypothetical protein